MSENAIAAASPVRLAVPRHLQDCNGYCGPACVMMVHSGTGGTVEAQHEMFRRVRDHAKQANDRRPVKSPAESLLALLNTRGGKWEKMFRTEPQPVAARIVDAVERLEQPCLLLVSKGLHWVVAFGRTLCDDGSVGGVLLRDPAWAGMPGFFGLTTVPQKPTFTHSAQFPCQCLESDQRNGTVHERYISLDELLSPRGLQGSPDWEGRGALALVPVESVAVVAALPVPSHVAGAAAAGITPAQAAMQQAREHGLFGRHDSPPDWQAVLDGGQPGQPVLVKDPNDPRDDFYLVPVYAGNAALCRAAWFMLDPVTLRLREASLLDNWMIPAFPTDQDANNIANNEVTLPDGTRHRFKKSDLRPNQRNLVWAGSAATILPYWPLREFTAPHPQTGEQVSIYATQHGEIYTALGPDDVPATQGGQSARQTSDGPKTNARSPWKKWLGAGAAAAGIAVAAVKFIPAQGPAAPPTPYIIPGLNLSIAGITQDSARFTWPGVPNATFKVQYRKARTAVWITVPGDKVTGTQCDLTGLESGETYEAQITVIAESGEASLPSEPVAFKTESIPPNPELPVIQQKLREIDAGLKTSYTRAREVMEKSDALPAELSRLEEEIARITIPPVGEKPLTREELELLRSYLKLAQSYGGQVKRVKPPHPVDADPLLAEFTLAATAMSALAGAPLTLLSETPGPEFRKAFDALATAIAALADTLPAHQKVHSDILAYMRACDEEADKILKEMEIIGAEFFRRDYRGKPNDREKLEGLANRAFKLAHKVKRERHEHDGETYRPPSVENFTVSGTADEMALLTDLIGAVQLDAWSKEIGALSGAEPQKQQDFLRKVAQTLFDLAHERKEHEAALELLKSLQDQVLSLKDTKPVFRLLGGMVSVPEPGILLRINELLKKVADLQARLGSIQGGHSDVLTSLTEDEAEVAKLKSRYEIVLAAIPPAGPRRNAADDRIITELNVAFPRLQKSMRDRRDGHTKAQQVLPGFHKNIESMRQRLEAMRNKLQPAAPATRTPAVRPSTKPEATAKPVKP